MPEPGLGTRPHAPSPSPSLRIRLAVDTDWPAIWPILSEVVTTGETMPYDPAMTSESARDMWLERPPGQTVVALLDGEIAGTAKMSANRPGAGAHVSTASFMVASGTRGRGVGTALCRYALTWARDKGFASMQFNAVVETNTAAVALYQREGFQIVGTVPRSFHHPSHGRVGLHVMYQEFTRDS
ncbi:GNAT family N-acetyltransferase [Actinoplanes derwentensis]|uniref:L-amino acid N-acyltransferase YncA n=1 Tax=Actinoplanes derwentensis TaxID=113562 RepID=A0A1H2CH60_9ACTN|nr:GNAT family N-acetyltransferase [Actinoplanes derwentensis]GID86128.1 N-acetyltransferase [Actinoplanes derwentensis]SDT69436.1 L-amino acid N-acyltransferase YncA [Actinoplanes derwentensis]